MRHLLIFSFAVAVLLPGCGSIVEPKVSCPDHEVQQFLGALDRLIYEWEDATEIGMASTQITVPPVVKEMQSIRRQVKSLEVPECASHARSDIGFGMENYIDTYLSFMLGDEYSWVAIQMDVADGCWEKAMTDLAAFRADPIAAYEAAEAEWQAYIATLEATTEAQAPE